MYGTPLGHTPAPCHGPPTRLPLHNPRLHATPKHGHVSRNLCFLTILLQPEVTCELTVMVYACCLSVYVQLKTEPIMGSVMDGINVKSLEEHSEGDVASPSSTGTQVLYGKRLLYIVIYYHR